MPDLMMLASGVGLVAATAPLGTRGAAGRSPAVRWSYLDRRHFELVFVRRLGRDRDRTVDSYLGYCRHAGSSLRATIVSRATGASAGLTVLLSRVYRIGVDTSRGRRIRDRLQPAQDDDVGEMRRPPPHRPSSSHPASKKVGVHQTVDLGDAVPHGQSAADLTTAQQPNGRILGPPPRQRWIAANLDNDFESIGRS